MVAGGLILIGACTLTTTILALAFTAVAGVVAGAAVITPAETPIIQIMEQDQIEVAKMDITDLEEVMVMVRMVFHLDQTHTDHQITMVL